MVKVFIPTCHSLAEIQNIISEINEKGIDAQNTTVEESFAEFAKTLQPNDDVLVYSLDCFASLIDMLDSTRQYNVESLSEPWFSQPIVENREYLGHLYDLAIKMHANRTRLGLERAKREGKVLGRTVGKRMPPKMSEQDLVQVDTLRREQNLSVREACQKMGCSTFTYYKTRKRLFSEEGGA